MGSTDPIPQYPTYHPTYPFPTPCPVLKERLQGPVTRPPLKQLQGLVARPALRLQGLVTRPALEPLQGLVTRPALQGLVTRPAFQQGLVTRPALALQGLI